MLLGIRRGDSTSLKLEFKLINVIGNAPNAQLPTASMINVSPILNIVTYGFFNLVWNAWKLSYWLKPCLCFSAFCRRQRPHEKQLKLS